MIQHREPFGNADRGSLGSLGSRVAAGWQPGGKATVSVLS